MINDRDHSPEYYFNLGNSYKKKGMLDQAVFFYKKSLLLNPESCEALNNLGNALREQGQFDDALQIYEMALKVSPGYINAQHNIGFTYLEMAEFDKAVEYFTNILKIYPQSAETYNNLGVALREKGKFNEARQSFLKALSINPDLQDARQNMSSLHLLLGNFQDGWREYRWFWNLRGPYHDLQKPLWDGSDIMGKTLLLHMGAGFGDTIQFVRYAPMIKERGAEIILGCNRTMGRLLEGVEGIQQVIIEGERIPHVDVQSSMFRLPIIFDTSMDSIPARVPYIKVDRRLISEWKEKVSDGRPSFKIGLNWAGGHNTGIYRYRACPPEMFSKLSEMANVSFYSLFFGKTENIIQSLKKDLGLIDFTDEIRDFSDTAALIENLDLVISIDTAVVHLAGALGKTVWTLLPHVPDWRWLLDREDSPWYPTMRLFRQPSPGDWTSVINKVIDELKERIGKVL